MSSSVLVLNRFAMLIASVMLATVSATSPAYAGDETKATHEEHPVFYPALPDPPRIQLLATLTGEQDLRPPSSSFAKFILGDDNSTQQLVQPYGRSRPPRIRCTTRRARSSIIA